MTDDQYRACPERAAKIAELVASFPPLTPAQIERLRLLFARRA